MSQDPDNPVLSVLMPVFNEGATLADAIGQLEKSGLGASFELVIVDDGSSDASAEIIARAAADRPWIRPFRHASNRGKGAAIRTAIDAARGDYVCILDADLEYEPSDMAPMLEVVLARRAEVVYGVRAFGGHAAHSYWYVLGNRLVTTFANVLFNSYLRDVMTCFKLMPTSIAKSLDITSDGFALEAEITGKLLRRGHRIFEIPISYNARSHAQGKKLRSRDAASVLGTLVWSRIRPSP